MTILEFKKVIYLILESLSNGKKNLTADKLEIDEILFRETCEWLEERNLVNGIDFQYYMIDFSNAKVTSEGMNYLQIYLNS
ncbi:hypothetical protein CON22_24695 [Bacillus cereus]|nr:hypothetical protein CON22_24695 [Bacillus cereus]